MMLSLHERLQYCRKNLDLSIQYVSQLLQISEDLLKQIETGHVLPDESLLNQMEKIYGYPLTKDTTDSNSFHDRNGRNLSRFDLMQVHELLAFQKELSKRNYQ